MLQKKIQSQLKVSLRIHDICRTGVCLSETTVTIYFQIVNNYSRFKHCQGCMQSTKKATKMQLNG